MTTNILLLEDDEDFALGLALTLQRNDFTTHHATTLQEALSLLSQNIHFHAACVDLSLPDAHGCNILTHLKAAAPDCAMIVLTGRDDASTAVEALQHGAANYLTKPVRSHAIIQALQEVTALHTTHNSSSTSASISSHQHPILGDSPTWRNVLNTAQSAALNSRVTVLLTGEPGVGKDVLARFIHRNSAQRRAPFIPVNVPALPDSLIESEFFGHEPGSFTGALKTRRGVFELAQDGIIFLDEIGDMPLHLQPKLLRVLEGHPFYRVGGERPISCNARIISATNRPLSELVQQGLFRADLYHRLRVLEIRIPPLRQRPEDIQKLALYFLARLAAEQGVRNARFSPQTLSVLCSYTWPGNIRELRNVVERALVLSRGSIILPQHLPSELSANLKTNTPTPPPTPPETSNNLTLEHAVYTHIQHVLELCDGNITQAARLLGITRQTLRRKLQSPPQGG